MSEPALKSPQIATGHFVTFLSPAISGNAQTTRAINGWDVVQAIAMSRSIVEEYGAKPFAFHFFTLASGREVARSSRYYLGGTLLTLDQLKSRDDPEDQPLISQMEQNGFREAVVNNNSWKVTQPLLPGDVVLTHNGSCHLAETPDPLGERVARMPKENLQPDMEGMERLAMRPPAAGAS